MYTDHIEMVKEALAGTRKVDEQTLSSMAALEERLDRLKSMSPAFAGISFSPAVEGMMKRAAVIA